MFWQESNGSMTSLYLQRKDKFCSVSLFPDHTQIDTKGWERDLDSNTFSLLTAYFQTYISQYKLNIRKFQISEGTKIIIDSKECKNNHKTIKI